jgi:hypothetical protein
LNNEPKCKPENKIINEESEQEMTDEVIDESSMFDKLTPS